MRESGISSPPRGAIIPPLVLLRRLSVSVAPFFSSFLLLLQLVLFSIISPFVRQNLTSFFSFYFHFIQCQFFLPLVANSFMSIFNCLDLFFYQMFFYFHTQFLFWLWIVTLLYPQLVYFWYFIASHFMCIFLALLHFITICFTSGFYSFWILYHHLFYFHIYFLFML